MKYKNIAACAVFSSIIVIGFVYFYLNGPSISAQLSRNGNACKIEYPIAVTVNNFTFNTVYRSTFRMEAWRKGRSVNILASGPEKYTFDKIVSPFTSETLCYADEYFKVADDKNAGSKPSLNSITTFSVAKIIEGVNEFMRRSEGVEVHVYDFLPQRLE